MNHNESSLVDYDSDGDNDIVAISYNKINGHFLFENQGEFEHRYLPETVRILQAKLC